MEKKNIRICDGTIIRKNAKFDSCVDVCDEKECPQKLIKKSNK